MYQLGICRHLQFEAAVTCKSTTTHKSHSSHNVIQEVDNSKSPAGYTDLESSILSDVGLRCPTVGSYSATHKLEHLGLLAAHLNLLIPINVVEALPSQTPFHLIVICI